ncbi:MAG: aconitase X swivel domain-containing protein [Anaerolineae bacterium]
MAQSIVPCYLHTFSIPTPFPVGPVNVYLAEGEPLTLVDTGPRYDSAREELEKALAGCGYRVSDLQRITITHAHADHCGLAAELVRASGAEVLTHTANLPRLADNSDAQRMAFYSEVMHWAGIPVDVMVELARMQRGIGRYTEPVTPDRSLAEGDVLQLGGEDWQVLHTPGHAGGLICLYQPQRRLLISSDHLLRDISSNPIVEPPAPGEAERPRRRSAETLASASAELSIEASVAPRSRRSLVEYMAQLRRVAALDVTLALPGHGPPITDHRALIRERLAFHEERAHRVLETLSDESLTVHEIAGMLFPTLDPINTFLAISEVIGHLQWLEVEGRVMHTEQDGVAFWKRVDCCPAIRVRGRVVKAGRAEGEALVSPDPIGFLGGVDPDTGVVIEAGHPLEGQCVAGRVLVFPTGKGSTVGSYTLYRLARNGLAPVAIVNAEADPVVAVGAIIAEIPMVDQVAISRIRTGDLVQVHDGEVIVWQGGKSQRASRGRHEREV